MNMGVAGSLVMDGKVGAHPLVHKVVLHISPDKGKLLFPGQFAGQSRLNLTGKLAVPGFLDLLDTVPELSLIHISTKGNHIQERISVVAE